MPASYNNAVAASARCARSGEARRFAPRRQPLNVMRNHIDNWDDVNLTRMKPRWQQTKAALKWKSKEDLLKLIRCLYDMAPENRAFIEAFVGSVKEALDQYRERVSEAVAPAPSSNKRISLSKAKQAIREYRRAAGDPVGVVDLMLCYVEAGTDFAVEYGYGDEGYFDSMEGVFEDMLKELDRVPLDGQSFHLKRIDRVVAAAGGVGWGYGDALADRWRTWQERARRRVGRPTDVP